MAGGPRPLALLRRLHLVVPDPVAAHALLGLIATGWSVSAYAFWQVRDYERFLPVFWPLWYAATAAACWAFWLRPGSRRALIVSGAMSFVAVLSRTGAVAVNLLAGEVYPSPWYGVLGLVLYPLFAFALLYVWDLGFGDLWSRHRGPRRGGTGGGPDGNPGS